MRRKKFGTRDKIYAILAIAVIILIAAITSLVGVYLHSARTRNEEMTNKEPPQAIPAPPVETEPLAKAPVIPTPAASTPIVPTPVVPAPIVPAPAPIASVQPPPSSGVKTKGVLVFVIDDAGHNLHDLEPFLNFPGPLTIAVMPGLSYSAEAARRIRSSGKEVFLHQPMEALAGHDPGPGAIRSGMGAEEIRAIVNRNLDELWPVAGMNNHEGSRITMDGQAMETILSVCRERGIVFLDSRTTAETAVPMAARRMGMVIGERDVFLDNVQEVESMTGYINTGLSRAEQNGQAIMIGHVWSPDLAPLLTELFPGLSEQGYTFSQASKVIGGTGQ